jgi:hypothetical protein
MFCWGCEVDVCLMYWCIIDVLYEDITEVINFETFFPI